jgi:hypothetical protein
MLHSRSRKLLIAKCTATKDDEQAVSKEILEPVKLKKWDILPDAKL